MKPLTVLLMFEVVPLLIEVVPLMVGVVPLIVGVVPLVVVLEFIFGGPMELPVGETSGGGKTPKVCDGSEGVDVSMPGQLVGELESIVIEPSPVPAGGKGLLLLGGGELPPCGQPPWPKDPPSRCPSGFGITCGKLPPGPHAEVNAIIAMKIRKVQCHIITSDQRTKRFKGVDS